LWDSGVFNKDLSAGLTRTYSWRQGLSCSYIYLPYIKGDRCSFVIKPTRDFIWMIRAIEQLKLIYQIIIMNELISI
jgi:hypothetical protein